MGSLQAPFGNIFVLYLEENVLRILKAKKNSFLKFTAIQMNNIFNIIKINFLTSPYSKPTF